MKNILLIALLAAAAPGVWAGSNTSSYNYSRDQALTARNIQEGVVVMVRGVQIDNRSKLNAGTAIGAAIGAAAAQSIDHRDTRRVARIVGTTAGGAVGSAAQRGMSGRRGVEIFVRTTDNRGRSEVISVVQDDDMHVQQGQRVLLTGKGRDIRVVPITGYGH